jgi:Holliday junction resolvase RusA-like endonuclease
MLAANFIVQIKGQSLGSIEMWVPGKPHTKKRPRARPGGKGQLYNPRENIQAEERVKKFFRSQFSGTPWIKRLPHTGPIKLTLYFIYAQPTTRWWDGRDKDDVLDLDNLAKTMMDGLNGIVWDDDKRIVGLHVEKFFWESLEGTYLCAEFFEPTRKG